MTRQSGSEHRNGHDESLAQPRNACIAVHHLAVREYLWPSDVEATVGVLGKVERRNEEAQHVTNGDRGNPAIHPPWCHHGGQALGEVAQHLE